MSTIALPVLVADRDALSSMHRQANEVKELGVFGIPDSAIVSRDYASYTNRLQDPETSWRPLGLAIHGPRAEVDRVTGRLGLLR